MTIVENGFVVHVLPHHHMLEMEHFGAHRIVFQIRLNSSNRSNIGRTTIPSRLDFAQIDILVKLNLDFANDWDKIGQNGGYHVIEHQFLNKSRGGCFFKNF